MINGWINKITNGLFDLITARWRHVERCNTWRADIWRCVRCVCYDNTFFVLLILSMKSII